MLVKEVVNAEVAVVPAGTPLLSMRGRRLDFVVLEHDEDLIGAAMRAELALMRHTQQAPAIRHDTTASGASLTDRFTA